MTNNVRVRFAPSPTGPLHIGGVRTALFNYLFAKKHQGTFVLRIEDTDQNRYVEGAEQYIIDALNWCGIPFDEGPGKQEKFGPYRQSERRHLYQKYALDLIETGQAYYAFDRSETLDAHRKEHEANGKTFIYNWHNRLKLSNSLSLNAKKVTEKLEAGEPYVIRFKTPENETLHLTDSIRGAIKMDTSTLDDKVLFKSDGMPTYHLANVVDDHIMQISHVIRGEEWLPSLALHYQLYRALGWEAPKFAHLPLILKPTGKGKLSKRDGDKLGFPVFPLQWVNPQNNTLSKGYKEDGYFPEAMVNFLALLGWNPGTEQEVFDLNGLVNTFDLERVNKSGARFDPDKINWFNHHYMQEQDNTVLALEFQKRHSELVSVPLDYITTVVNLIKERATFVSDFWGLSHYFFEAPRAYDDKASKKAFKEGSKAVLEEVNALVKNTSDFSSEALQEGIKSWINSSKLGFGKVIMPLRLALVGSLQGPDVFEIMTVIGKENTIKRIDSAMATL